MTIDGKIVLITGASQGIGLATAKLLASKGAKVAMAARSEDALTKLAAELPDSLAIPTDLLDAAAITRMVEATIDKYGRIDVLINNAGQGLYAPLEQIDAAEYLRIMELNVFAPLLAMQSVIPQMRAQGGGTIVNVSSMVSKMYIPHLSAYASTKYALNALSLTARAELEPDHIVVSVVYPTLTATDFGANALGGGRDALPANRRADLPPADSPENVADKIREAIETGIAETLLGQTR